MKWLFAAAALLGACSGGPHVTLTAAPPCTVTSVPQQLAIVAQCPTLLALDDGFVYWLDGSRLQRIEKCGSLDGPEILLSNVFSYELAVTSDAVYWPEGGRLLRMSTHDGVVTPVLEMDGQIDQVWADDAWVYVSGQSFIFDGTDETTLIWRLARHGGAPPEPLMTGPPGQLYELIGDGDNLYFSGSFVPLLARVDKRGGAMAGLVPDHETVDAGRLATDGEWVYYPTYPMQIHRVPVGGGDVDKVVDETANIAGLAADGEHLYWTVSNFFDDGALKRASTGGGTVTTLDQGHDIRALVVDRGAVYYGTCEPSGSGGIWIVHK